MTIWTHSFYLAMRTMRESLRQPGVEVGNIFIPLFFFAVILGSVSTVARSAFGVENFVAFQVPVAILQAVAGAASVSGIAMVTDIQRGYFDKLLLTPTSRWSIITGRILADVIRGALFTLLVVAIGLGVGSGLETGVAGGAMIVLVGALFGGGFSGIGISIALRTGSAQAAQAGFLLFFPLLFLAPAFAPLSIYSDWLRTIAELNPVTYILRGLRVLMLSGWDWEQIGYMFASVGGFAVVTTSLAVWTLVRRTR